MENTPEPTKAEIEAAWPIASRRGGSPPVKEQVTIMCDLHPKLARDGVQVAFVRLGAIPERFHAVIHDLALGSTCPAPDNKRDSYYTHDVFRWLRALGVEVEFKEP